MIHPYIKWTKSYNLSHQKGAFRIFISARNNGNFLGAVLYYTRSGEWSEHRDTINLHHELEQFIDRSEEGVYSQCTEWVNNNLHGTYDITEDETKLFKTAL